MGCDELNEPSVRSPAEIADFRQHNYNAEVVDLRRVHDELVMMRVRPDAGRFAFVPGQYTVLALGYWEPRLPDTQVEILSDSQRGKLARRAYSISCPLLNDSDQLVTTGSLPFLEFYITLVRRAEQHAPALTPRLFLMEVGDRIFVSDHPHGQYTLARVQPDDDVIFAATGTGEAPHNAMLAELLAAGHRGRLVSAICVRTKADLGYLQVHRRLESMYSNYRYLTLTTREPENTDPQHAGYVGKRYLQDYFASGDFARDADVALDPLRTHVYLCGSPAMIGVPHHTHDPAKRYPKPLGMVEVLERQGFQVDQPHEPGNVHFEKYW